MEDFLVTLLSIILLLAVAGLLICCAMALGLGDLFKKLRELFIYTKPKSGIDKEIAEEEKEIAELERQKEKMDKLSELRRRKERLFRDLGEEQRMMCTCGREFHSIDNYKEHLTNCFES